MIDELSTTIILVCSQSFLFGYCFSCLNPCLVLGYSNSIDDCYDSVDLSCPRGSIYRDLQLSTLETSAATALVILAAWVGSIIANYPLDRYGRRLVLLMNSLCFIIGGALTASGLKIPFFLGRFIVGLGVGVISVLCPIMLSEIAPTSSRGFIVTMHQLALVAGIFLSSFIAYGFISYLNHGWQYVMIIQAIPAILLLCNYSKLPESPKWLVNHDRHEEAFQVLCLLRLDNINDYDCEYRCREELRELQNESKVHSDEKVSPSPVKRDLERQNDESSWQQLLQCRKAVIIGSFLCIFMAMTGINTIVFYSTTIFGFSGVTFSSPSSTILATSFVSGANLVTTAITAFFIDRMGRKNLLLIGQYIMLVSLFILATVLIIPVAPDLSDHRVVVLSSMNHFTIDQQIQGIVSVVCVLLFVMGFAMGLGAVTWTVISEIMPTHLRAKGMSLFLSFNWALNLLIALGTLTAINILGDVSDDMDVDDKNNANKEGIALLYYIFFGITVMSIVFTHLMVPQKSSNDVEDNINLNEPLLDEKDNNT